jgi:hypothetical protein
VLVLVLFTEAVDASYIQKTETSPPHSELLRRNQRKQTDKSILTNRPRYPRAPLPSSFHRLLRTVRKSLSTARRGQTISVPSWCDDGAGRGLVEPGVLTSSVVALDDSPQGLERVSETLLTGFETISDLLGGATFPHRQIPIATSRESRFFLPSANGYSQKLNLRNTPLQPPRHGGEHVFRGSFGRNARKGGGGRWRGRVCCNGEETEARGSARAGHKDYTGCFTEEGFLFHTLTRRLETERKE